MLPRLWDSRLFKWFQKVSMNPVHCLSCLPPPPVTVAPTGKRKSDVWFWSPPGITWRIAKTPEFWASFTSCVVRGNNVRIRKELSVCFSVDSVITSQDIITGLDKAGIDIDDITSIQRRASNNSWVVTFGSKAVNDAALNEHAISITGCSVLLGNCENEVSIVKIYEFPDEMPHCRHWLFSSLRQSNFLSTRPRGGHHFQRCSYRENVYWATYSRSDLYCRRVCTLVPVPT